MFEHLHAIHFALFEHLPTHLPTIHFAPVRAPLYNLFSHVHPPPYSPFALSSTSLQSIFPMFVHLPTNFPCFVHLLTIYFFPCSSTSYAPVLGGIAIPTEKQNYLPRSFCVPSDGFGPNEMQKQLKTRSQTCIRPQWQQQDWWAACMYSNRGGQSSLRSCLRQAKRARAAWQTLGHRAGSRTVSDRITVAFAFSVCFPCHSSPPLSLSHTDTRARA